MDLFQLLLFYVPQHFRRAATTPPGNRDSPCNITRAIISRYKRSPNVLIHCVDSCASDAGGLALPRVPVPDARPCESRASLTLELLALA